MKPVTELEMLAVLKAYPGPIQVNIANICDPRAIQWCDLSGDGMVVVAQCFIERGPDGALQGPFMVLS